MSYHLGMYLGEQKSVAIIRNGKIEVAIEQSRLENQTIADKQRLDLLRTEGLRNGLTFTLPKESIRYCLDQVKIKWDELQTITPLTPGLDLGVERLKSEWLITNDNRIERAPSVQLAQAYTTYFHSPFEEAVILIVDSIGSFIQNAQQEIPHLPSYSLYYAKGHVINDLYQQEYPEKYSQLCTIFGIYEMMSKKIMPLVLQKDLSEQEFSYLGQKTVSWLSSLASYAKSNELFSPWFQKNNDSKLGIDVPVIDIWLFIENLLFKQTSNCQKIAVWIELLGHLQKETARILKLIAQSAMESCDTNNLCFGGALTLDYTINTEFLDAFSHNHIFVNPIQASTSIAIGCALYTEKQKSIVTIPRYQLGQLDFGKSYQNGQIESALQAFNGMVVVDDEQPTQLEMPSQEFKFKKFATAIIKGNVIGRFDGALDCGIHSLGRRVALINPSIYLSKEIINQQVLEIPSFCDHPIVCPREVAHEYFEDVIDSPYGLFLAKPLASLQNQLLPILRPDQRVLLYTVDQSQDLFLWKLCHSLHQYFDHLPLLMMATLSRNLQNSIESPVEAIQWLLSGNLDSLFLGNHWVKLRQQMPKNTMIKANPIKNIPSIEIKIDQNDIIDLDLQIFKRTQHPKEKYASQDLIRLSQNLAKYRIYSQLFETHPLHPKFKGFLNQHLSVLLHPHGKSLIIDEWNQFPIRTFDWVEIHLLFAVLHPQKENGIDHKVRLQQILNLHPLECQSKIEWACAEVESYGLFTHSSWISPAIKPTEIELDLHPKFVAFKDKSFSLKHILHPFWKKLKTLRYDEMLRDLEAQPLLLTQLLEEYQGNLIRLFFLGETCTKDSIVALFGEDLYRNLIKSTILAQNSHENCYSTVKIESIASALIITDFDPYYKNQDAQSLARGLSVAQIFDQQANYSQKSEGLCLPISPWLKGLAHLYNPQPYAESHQQMKILDMSNTYGLFAILSSIYASKSQITVSSERALRFTHLNLQFNGCENYQVNVSDSLKDTPNALYDFIFSKYHLEKSIANYLSENGRIYHFAKDMDQIPMSFYSMHGALLGLYITQKEIEWDDHWVDQLSERYFGYWVFERKQKHQMPYYRAIDLPHESIAGYIDRFFKSEQLTDQKISLLPREGLSLNASYQSNRDLVYTLYNHNWPSLKPVKMPILIAEQIIDLFDKKSKYVKDLQNLSFEQKKKLISLGFFEGVFSKES
jgi:carbamoyltransferase